MELGISGLVQTIGIDEEGGAWCERRLLLRINESHAAGAMRQAGRLSKVHQPPFGQIVQKLCHSRERLPGLLQQSRP